MPREETKPYIPPPPTAARAPRAHRFQTAGGGELGITLSPPQAPSSNGRRKREGRRGRQLTRSRGRTNPSRPRERRGTLQPRSGRLLAGRKGGSRRPPLPHAPLLKQQLMGAAMLPSRAPCGAQAASGARAGGERKVPGAKKKPETSACRTPFRGVINRPFWAGPLGTHYACASPCGRGRWGYSMMRLCLGGALLRGSSPRLLPASFALGWAGICPVLLLQCRCFIKGPNARRAVDMQSPLQTGQLPCCGGPSVPVECAGLRAGGRSTQGCLKILSGVPRNISTGKCANTRCKINPEI